jgi:Flp pilus assembly protein TadG
MLRMLKKLRRDERGNVLILMAAAMPLLVGSAGLAVDTIQWTLWKRQLQRAADSAALAGVYQRVQGADLSGVQSAVTRDLGFNQNTGITLFSGYPQVALPADTGQMRQQVQVTLGVQKSLTFSSMFMSAPPIIVASATAASIPGLDEYCLVSLENNAANTGITFIGNAGVEMNCSAISNSPSANSAVARGSSIFKAPSVAAVGGIQRSANFQVERYEPYVPALTDPYANVRPRQADLDSQCTASSSNGNGNNTSELNEDTVLPASQSVFCFNSLRVGSNRTLNLRPGTYYINGGDAIIQGDLSCTGCTIVLTNRSTANDAAIGQLRVNADSKVNMTPPVAGCTLGTDGCFKGISIYQDRRALDSNSLVNRINGNSGSQILGAVYFPRQEIVYNGTGTSDFICTRLVGRRVNFSGNSSTTNKFGKDCGALGMDPIMGGRRVRLVG